MMQGSKVWLVVGERGLCAGVLGRREGAELPGEDEHLCLFHDLCCWAREGLV